MEKLFKEKRFQFLFIPLMLGGMNDSLIRNAVIIWYTYFVQISWPTRDDLVTLTVFTFVLPSLLFASYAGKFADMHDKAKVLRTIKLFEILVVILGIVFVIFNMPLAQLIVVFALGVHSTFAGPIKYSTLPQYYDNKKVILATSYMEFGTLFAILIGQLIGGMLTASKMVIFIGIIAIFCAIVGYLVTFKMYPTKPATKKVKFHKNIFLDNWHTYKSVVANPNSKINLHAIAWFWCTGMIYTTQFSLFFLQYLGADGHVFSVLVGLYTLGLGIGALVIAWYFTKFGLNRNLVPICTFLVSVFTLIILYANRTPVDSLKGFHDFLTIKNHIIDMILLLAISIFSGIYSITCYADMQINATDEVRSQTIAISNWFNAFYIVVASLIFIALLPEFDIWNAMLVFACLNILFCIWYIIHKPKDMLKPIAISGGFPPSRE